MPRPWPGDCRFSTPPVRSSPGPPRSRAHARTGTGYRDDRPQRAIPVEGTMGQAKDGIHLAETVADVDALQVANPELLAYVTQTTLSMDDAAAIVDALRKRFPAIVGPKKDDICYATQNRQDAVKFMAPGGRGLCGWLAQQLELQPAQEVAELRGVPAYLVTTPTASIRHGSRASAASASRPAHRRRRCLSRRSSNDQAPRRRVGETARGCAGEDHLPLPKELQLVPPNQKAP